MSSEDSNSRSVDMLLEQPNPGLLGQSPVAPVEMGVLVTGDTNPTAQARPLPFDIRLLEGFFLTMYFTIFYGILFLRFSTYLSIYLSIHL